MDYVAISGRAKHAGFHSGGIGVASLPSRACGTARPGFLSFLAWFLLRLLVDTGGVGLEWLSPDLDDFYVGYTKH